MVTVAFSQQNPGSPKTIKTISGVVTKIDFVGNTISILSDDQHQMSFSVPENAIITQDTQDIGLMDIKESNPVTIQYDIASPGMDVVESIIDNKPSSHE